jgi:hypothetical protein
MKFQGSKVQRFKVQNVQRFKVQRFNGLMVQRFKVQCSKDPELTTIL